MKSDEYLDSYDMFCDDTITTVEETTKALKDVIGAEYEAHRKRIYEKLGFRVEDEIHDERLAAFNADWYLYDKGGNLAIIEECKGHYVDSCFAERAVFGFAKTAQRFLDLGLECPYFILSSTTKYRLFDEKFEESLGVLRPDIADALRGKVKYFSVVQNDRFGPKKWLPRTSRPLQRTADTAGWLQPEINFLTEVRG
tara:strand:+ start:233 stop:823 length:591 start_codon:yes stop_codon:yes gene_type:complete